MRKVWINATAGLLALVLAATAGGQPPSQPKSPPPKAEASKPPAKSKLEELLAQALQNNADIRVAAAKLNEADAELHRTRLQVMHKVVQAYHAVEIAQTNVTHWQKKFVSLKEQITLKEQISRAPGSVTRRDLEEVESQVETAKRDLEEVESQVETAKAKLAAAAAELLLLVGKGPMESRTSRAKDSLREGQADLEMWAERRAWAEGMARRGYITRSQVEADYRKYLEALEAMQSKLVTGPLADKKALDRPITVTAKDEPLSKVLDAIRKASGLTIQFQSSKIDPLDPLEKPVTVKLENVSLGAALQWLEDAAPGYQVVVRDYGLLLAPKDALPRGALLLNDFWKMGDKPKTDDAPKK
jgi:hypothetical protein